MYFRIKQHMRNLKRNESVVQNKQKKKLHLRITTVKDVTSKKETKNE